MLGLFLVGLVVVVALLCPVLAPYDPNDQAAMMGGVGARAAPSWAHLLGTDRTGYDVLSRVLLRGADGAGRRHRGDGAGRRSWACWWAASPGIGAACADEVLMRFTESSW